MDQWLDRNLNQSHNFFIHAAHTERRKIMGTCLGRFLFFKFIKFIVRVWKNLGMRLCLELSVKDNPRVSNVLKISLMFFKYQIANCWQWSFLLSVTPTPPLPLPLSFFLWFELSNLKHKFWSSQFTKRIFLAVLPAHSLCYLSQLKCSLQSKVFFSSCCCEGGWGTLADTDLWTTKVGGGKKGTWPPKPAAASAPTGEVGLVPVCARVKGCSFQQVSKWEAKT